MVTVPRSVGPVVWLIAVGMWAVASPPAKPGIPEPLLSAFAENKDKYLRNVRIRTTERRYDDDGRVRHELGHVYVGGRERFTLKEFDPATGAEKPETWVGTPQGIFLVSPGKQGDSYVIRKQLPMTDASFFAVCRGDIGVSLPVGLFEVSVVDYLALPDLTIKGVDSVEWYGRRLARLTAVRNVRTGYEETLFFDPDHNWVLHGNETRSLRTGGKSVARVLYAADGETPRRWEFGSVPPGGGEVRAAAAVDVIEFRREEVPDAELSLSQFGLPEPVGAAPPRPAVPTPVWLLVAAAACGGGAFLFRRLARGRAGATAAAGGAER